MTWTPDRIIHLVLINRDDGKHFAPICAERTASGWKFGGLPGLASVPIQDKEAFIADHLTLGLRRYETGAPGITLLGAPGTSIAEAMTALQQTMSYLQRRLEQHEKEDHNGRTTD
jgi:hypothetical protein